MAQCKKCGKSGIFLKVDFDGLCEACARERVAAISPEQKEYLSLRDEIDRLTKHKDRLNLEIQDQRREIQGLDNTIKARKNEIVVLDDEILLQSFGLYHPQYEFATSDRYKEELKKVRDAQKFSIKNNTAATGAEGWSVNGNVAEGRKMIADMKKLLLRAFNSECDETISHVRFNNMDASIKRIDSSRTAISKLGKVMNVAITDVYYNLKISELKLAYEYQVKKQEEKEEQKRLREEMREQAKLEKEIEEARKKLEKEQQHYQHEWERILERLTADIPSDERAALEKKKEELSFQLDEISKARAQVDYRAANQKAGYVYIISNIGAFGENVYKIGMTRRLEPMDRIDELGDASVPFDFDVHAMIFSKDAPALETALHNAFSGRKLNMVNLRREFFNVTLGEIEQVVKANYDKLVEFVEIPPAQQYRESLAIRKQQKEEQNGK